MRRPAPLRTLIGVGCGLALAAAAPAAAQPAVPNLERQAGVALGVLGVTSLPDGTVSDLTISRGSGESAGLFNWQLGSGFTWSEDVPIYLEGYLGFARYDPVFIASSGQARSRVPLRWNTVAATGGVGWSFALTDRLQLRPIFNLSLGYVASDLAIAGEVLNLLTGIDIEALRATQAATGGFGGALVLAWYDYRPEWELEAELRFTRLRFETLPAFSRGLDVTSDSAATNLWVRYRWPTGAEAFGRPTRWVLEGYHSEFFLAQREVLGIDRLTRLGGGIELDVGRWELGAAGLYLQRLRLSGNVLVGEDVRGWSVGIGMSF